MRYSHIDEFLPLRAFQRGANGAIQPQGGKGGGKAPAPDPSIGQAQLKMADLADKQYSMFEKDIWPTLQQQNERQQTQADNQQSFSNEIAREQLTLAKRQAVQAEAVQAQNMKIAAQNAKYASDYHDRMVEKFYPLQDKLLQQATDYNTDANREQIASSAIGDVSQAFANQRESQERQMRSYGMDPTSGAYQSTTHASGVQEAAAKAAAATQARSAALQLGWNQSLSALGLGAQLPNDQVSASGMALNAGNSAISAGSNALSGYSIPVSTAGTSLGMGQIPIQNTSALGGSINSGTAGAGGLYNNVGGLGVQSYQQQISAWNAEKQANATSSAGIGSAIGMIGGAALSGGTGGFAGSAVGKLFSGSDVRLKENITVVGHTASGLAIYEFEYKPQFKDKPYAGHGRFRGVMAHEVERVIPSAVFTTPDGYKAVDYSQVN